MKSIICLSASWRTVCQQASVCFPLYRGLSLCNSSERLKDPEFLCKTSVIAQQPCVTDARCFQRERTRIPAGCAPKLYPVPASAARRNKMTSYHTDVNMVQLPTDRGAQQLSPYTPYAIKAQQGTLVNIQSLFEEEVIIDLCSKLAGFSCNDRAEGLATLLEACVEFGLEAQSPPVLILVKECLELLSNRDVGVAQLCHLGKVACALEGRESRVVTEVLNSIICAVEEDMVSPSEAAAVYSLLTAFYEPSCQRQTLMLSALHRQTQRQVHRLRASQVSEILQSLVKLKHKQAISLVLRLTHRASRIFKDFSDGEIIKVLSALMILKQHDDELLAAMEKHLPGRLGKCDPELISTVMDYCLHTRCRSELIFEAVAENFVCSAETHTDMQITKQVVAIGRLNYLPQCSNQMFEKLEKVLSARFSNFKPRSLIDVLHACIHLERFPLNYMVRIFSPYFRQKRQANSEPVDKTVLGQLTQLHLSASLECTCYLGPKLPFFLHMKKFSSPDQAFESPMETLLYRQVTGPLVQLLGGKFFSTRVFTSIGYTVDLEISVDENGFILPQSQWEHTYKRIALCLDGPSRFCRHTQHLLGKEATKRRHLQRIGYEVVEIPYFEFEKQETQEQQVKYLHDKILPAISKCRLNPPTD